MIVAVRKGRPDITGTPQIIITYDSDVEITFPIFSNIFWRVYQSYDSAYIRDDMYSLAMALRES